MIGVSIGERQDRLPPRITMRGQQQHRDHEADREEHGLDDAPHRGRNARWQIRLKGRVARSSRFLLPPQYLEEPPTSLLMPCVLRGAVALLVRGVVRCFATGQRGMSSACHGCRCSMMDGQRAPFGWLGVLMILNDWVVLIGSTFLALVIVALLVMALLGPPTLG